jgi:hypothetical protein
MGVKSIIVSVPKLGNYSIKALSASLSGSLQIGETLSVFDVNSARSFFNEAQFSFRTARPGPPGTGTPVFSEAFSLPSQTGSIFRVTLFAFILSSHN